MVLVICAYALPLTVGIGATRSDPYEWEEGHFVKVAQEIAGRWLQMYASYEPCLLPGLFNDLLSIALY